MCESARIKRMDVRKFLTVALRRVNAKMGIRGSVVSGFATIHDEISKFFN
jgi:hypothetical protein